MSTVQSQLQVKKFRFTGYMVHTERKALLCRHGIAAMAHTCVDSRAHTHMRDKDANYVIPHPSPAQKHGKERLPGGA